MEDKTSHKSRDAIADKTEDNSQPLQKLDSLSETLQNDISSVNPDSAFKLIDE